MIKKYKINIIRNGLEGRLLSTAEYKGFDSETMSDWTYWFKVGWYKTVNGAVRQSVKQLKRLGKEFSDEEVAKAMQEEI